MRVARFALLSLLMSSSALAGTEPEFAPVPDWVKKQELPSSTTDSELPVRLVFDDEQTRLKPGEIATYSDLVMKVQTGEGLSAGNVNLNWRPELDRLVIHQLVVIRDGQQIDVLKSQKFNVLRRETDLESSTLDGSLTASLQIEGLQVGDTIRLTRTYITKDPVFGRHVERLSAGWNDFATDRAHFRLTWPDDVKLRIRSTADLPAVSKGRDGTFNVFEFSRDGLQPRLVPSGAPQRYSIGRVLEATDYSNWGELSAQFAPLYDKASKVNPTGALQAEINKIKALSGSKKAKVEAALKLVQSTRYLALQMGTGGLVPTDADVTWNNRYGDCKAKTAMLLAVLRQLGVAADAVLVNTDRGDGLNDRLPMIAMFNHVLVRASIDGSIYWLDGTRTGDLSIDRLRTPDFYWGLPLTGPNAQLVKMRTDVPGKPDVVTKLTVDAMKGIYGPVSATAEILLHGDDAITAKNDIAALPAASRDPTLRSYWKKRFAFIEPTSMTTDFNATTGQLTLKMVGKGKLEWDDRGNLFMPRSTLAFKADFSRPEGPDADAPFETSYPSHFQNEVTILLPKGEFEFWKGNGDVNVDETLAGVHYSRTAAMVDNVVRVTATERSVLPEIAHADALAAQPALRELYDRDVYLVRKYYSPSDEDVVALKARRPRTADDFEDRGLLYERADYHAEAEADFTQQLKLDPKSVWAFANRSISRFQLMNVAGADADLRDGAAIDPQNVVILRSRGTVAMWRGDAKAAFDDFLAATKIEPENSYAHRRLAIAAHRIGRDDVALAASNKVLADDPDAGDIRLIRATIHLAAGNVRELKADLEKLSGGSAENTTKVDLYSGAFFATYGDWAKASEYFDRALAAKKDSWTFVSRAFARPASAVDARRADLAEAVKLSPDDVDLMGVMAEFKSDTGDLKGAVADFDRAIAKAPDRYDLLVKRGVVHARLGDEAQAVRDYDAAAKVAKTATDFNNLCWEKATAGVALERAKSECEKAIAMAPDNAAAIDSLAMVELKLGNVDAAIADYDRALLREPIQAASLLGRSLAWLKKGNQARADADKRDALKAAPTIVDRFRGYGFSLKD